MAGYSSIFDGTAPLGGNVGSANSQDQFLGYGTGFMNPDRFVLDMSKRVHLLNPSASPFFSWVSATRKKTASNTQYTWIEDELFTVRDFKATLIRSADGTEYVWALKIDPQDWQAIEAAAYADVAESAITAAKPTVFMTVTQSNGNNFSVIPMRNACIQGPIDREILDQDGAASTLGTVRNHIVIATRDATTTTIGTSDDWTDHEAEVAAVPSGVGGGAFTYTEWASASIAVTVHVYTPNETLAGFPQGSGLPNESRKRSRSRHNYTQIFKTPYSIANTLKAMAMYGPAELQNRRRRKAIEHMVDIERAMIFQGGGTEGTDWGELPGDGENPLTRFKGLGVGQTDGLIVSKNADNDTRYKLSTSATPDNVIDFIDYLFDDLVDDPSGVKVVLASNKWMNTLAKIAAQQDSSGGGFIFGGAGLVGKNALGFMVTELHAPSGILRFVRYPHFRGAFEDYALVLDMERFRIRPMNGRDTTLFANAGDKTIDGQIDYYQTETGLELTHESTCAIIKLTT